MGRKSNCLSCELLANSFSNVSTALYGQHFLRLFQKFFKTGWILVTKIVFSDAGRCPHTVLPTRKLKIEFSLLDSQEMSSCSVSFQMISEVLLSELVRSKFHILSLKVLKIPEFNLPISQFFAISPFGPSRKSNCVMLRFALRKMNYVSNEIAFFRNQQFFAIHFTTLPQPSYHPDPFLTLMQNSTQP